MSDITGSVLIPPVTLLIGNPGPLAIAVSAERLAIMVLLYSMHTWEEATSLFRAIGL